VRYAVANAPYVSFQKSNSSPIRTLEQQTDYADYT
jgi:hypothetical protein